MPAYGLAIRTGLATAADLRRLAKKTQERRTAQRIMACASAWGPNAGRRRKLLTNQSRRDQKLTLNPRAAVMSACATSGGDQAHTKAPGQCLHIPTTLYCETERLYQWAELTMRRVRLARWMDSRELL